MEPCNTGDQHKRRLPSTAWKKGQSGNPKGQPKKALSISEAFRSVLESNSIDVTLTAPNGETKRILVKSSVSIGRAIAARLSASALSGDVHAAKCVLARAYGEAPAQIDITGNTTPTGIVIEVVDAREKQA